MHFESSLDSVAALLEADHGSGIVHVARETPPRQQRERGCRLDHSVPQREPREEGYVGKLPAMQRQAGAFTAQRVAAAHADPSPSPVRDLTASLRDLETVGFAGRQRPGTEVARKREGGVGRYSGSRAD